MPDDKSALLRTLLGKLPETAASKLAQAIEMDRLMDGRDLPHEVILGGLRPSLGQSSRTLTPLRLFCQPFEDLLESAPRKTKHKAVIARACVVTVWTWVSRVLLPDDSHGYLRAAKMLILAGKQDDARAQTRSFWSLAGTAMRAALDRGEAVKLRADEIADAREMALLLGEGAEMEKVQARLPK